VRDKKAGSNQPSRFITEYVLTLLKGYFGLRQIRVASEWSGTVGYTPDEFPLVGLMDGKRLFMVGGMAGSGSAVSFNGARHVVCKILGIDRPDYYPEKYFSPRRFQKV
jgi:glycine/D-amino acid oxidase-like deaminating enzyme